MVTGRVGRERDRLGEKKKIDEDNMKEKGSAPPPPCQVLDGGLCVQIWGCYKPSIHQSHGVTLMTGLERGGTGATETRP